MKGFKKFFVELKKNIIVLCDDILANAKVLLSSFNKFFIELKRNIIVLYDDIALWGNFKIFIFWLKERINITTKIL
jgi:hypothetical protein